MLDRRNSAVPVVCSAKAEFRSPPEEGWTEPLADEALVPFWPPVEDELVAALEDPKALEEPAEVEEDEVGLVGEKKSLPRPKPIFNA